MSDYATRPRSWSQFSQYEQCPYQFYLQRVAEDRPAKTEAAWFGMGTAVHAGCEYWERSGRTEELGAMNAYKASYESEVNEALNRLPDPAEWESSGPYMGEADIQRRYKLGFDHVRNYITWYRDHPEQVIWINPEGEPAIELGFDIDLDGVRVVGKIDAVIKDGDESVVRDTKTGAKPGELGQLRVYAEAVRQMTGVDPQYGDFFMTKTGKPTKPYDLSEYPRDELVADFHRVDQEIKAENWDPKPSTAACGRCPVRDACGFKVT